ncbi:MAG: thioredoxin domain-containing protein [Isosphaeraceae bacterium]|jgi:uncharacterized protein YyaL (SSP411 family)|nr:MAG: thioredoxin domain-containing protein [Isosphaeraceae bacterium]
MTTPHADRPPNRLARETSPYLLQHAYNPVDWYPWGPEALQRARDEQKPIFLSVGYSACHWCHVMERESFEDETIAAFLNEHFVNIKVDREERPDLDQIYMSAVQAMTGRGGWPMSVFLTPDGQPFYGGTYFPPRDRHGMPGFLRVLHAVADAWRSRRTELVQSAQELVAQIAATSQLPPGSGPLPAAILDRAAHALGRSFDPVYGGFGDAPKFPHPMDLRFLLRYHARTRDPAALAMVRTTLDHMARGGIYDHLGGGFARYSTDARWLVPHFEKMLYDNALLASTYLDAFRATGDAEFARVACETMDYVRQRMTGDLGQVFATEDADSEGVEGKYYVWSLSEIEQILGPERARTFAYVYGVTAEGNWEHVNILHLPKPLDQAAAVLGRPLEELKAQLDADRAALLAVRNRRVPPGQDTKAIAAWNGLMIAAWAEGGRVLNEPRFLDAASRAASFVLDHMTNAEGRLLHVFKDGNAPILGFVDDYACMIDGLTRLFETSGQLRWLRAAVDFADQMIAHFQDPDDGGFFYTANDHERLIVRTKDALDNATPSGNAMAATALARLGTLTGREAFTQAAWAALGYARAILERYPTAAGQSLIALDFLLGEPRQIALIASADPRSLDSGLHAIYRRFLPGAVVAPSTDPPASERVELVPWLADRPARSGQLTAYVCRGYVCESPAVGLDALATVLDSV